MGFICWQWKLLHYQLKYWNDPIIQPTTINIIKILFFDIFFFLPLILLLIFFSSGISFLFYIKTSSYIYKYNIYTFLLYYAYPFIPLIYSSKDISTLNVISLTWYKYIPLFVQQFRIEQTLWKINKTKPAKPLQFPCHSIFKDLPAFLLPFLNLTFLQFTRSNTSAGFHHSMP